MNKDNKDNKDVNKRNRDDRNRDDQNRNNRPFKRPSHLKFNKDDDGDDINNILFYLMPPRNPVVPVPSVQPIVEETKIENECKNPVCDHKSFEEDDTPALIPDIKDITNIDDLITLGKSFHCKKNTEYSGLNLRVLCNLVPALTEMQNLVGMTNVKEKMVDQILFFLQGNHVTEKCGKCMDCSFNLKCLKSQTDMLHTVVTGPPGVGKTELGKILGKVYKEMGILSKGHFKIVSRSDLIAGYLGQTAIKTQKVIDDAIGGVLFIDEAYSLGNSELRDSFSKECIDTINQNLSEKRDLLCIVAGYEEQLEKCFFNYNEGLRRRFTFRYDLKPYKHNELMQIFERKIKDMQWELCYWEKSDDTEDEKSRKNTLKEKANELFRKNEKKFPNYGGDIETLALNCKISHTRRCSFDKTEKRRVLSVHDIENGIGRFLKNRKVVVHNDGSDKKTMSFYT